VARVLCLHGLGGTGATMWPLVATLSGLGHTVLAPTLPGHGTTPEDLLGVGWADWLAAARDWPADVVVGQSMGGALALALAAEGAVCGAAAINMPAPDPDALEGLEWRRSRGQEWVDVVWSGVDEVAYERLPLSALTAMHEGLLGLDLSAVQAPVLLVTSARDEMVDPASADLVAAALGGPVSRLTLDRGGHVASLDVDRDALADAVVAFVRTC
jgi:carboxylesterase